MADSSANSEDPETILFSIADYPEQNYVKAACQKYGIQRNPKKKKKKAPTGDQTFFQNLINT